MDFQGKHVVITGGAGGIGGALAKATAALGAKVVVSDLDLDAAQKIADQVGGLAVNCDVSDEAQIQQLILAAEQEFGAIDLFCSNAGFASGEGDHAASASNEVWMKNWQVHVMAHVYASRALLPKMIERGDGYLVNIASAAGLLSQISDAAYTATKHAAVAFAESLAITHAEEGIKVSVVCPQYVDTNIISMFSPEERADLPGVLSAEECAERIVEGIHKEEFLITPHPEVRQYMQFRAADGEAWLGAMRKLRNSLIDDDGKLDLARIFKSVSR